MKLFVFLMLMSAVSFSNEHKVKHHGMKVEKDNKSRAIIEKAAREQFLSLLKINESLHISFFKYDAKHSS